MNLEILQLPRTLFGLGALENLESELRRLNLSKPLIVTDKGVSGSGLVDKTLAILNGYDASIFDTVTENNVFADADGGADAYRNSGCDCIIGLGGGSVLDTAKCIAVLIENPGTIADYALNPSQEISGAAPIIAISTTAGTGSDADIYAGIHADAQSPGVGIASHHVIPVVAILDPNMTATLPARSVAATGIDALSHCIEGYLSNKDVPFAKLIALEGIKKGVGSIHAAVSGNSEDARMDMLLASYAGGVAMSMGTGPAHAIALTCSEQGFPHGLLSGIGIVMTLDHTLSLLPDQRAALGHAMGTDLSPGAYFTTLMESLGLPTSLGGLGYTGDVGLLASAAHQHFLNGFAVTPPSLGDYRKMFETSLKM